MPENETTNRGGGILWVGNKVLVEAKFEFEASKYLYKQCFKLRSLEINGINVDPGALQSGFGVTCLFGSGEFSENFPAISQRIL